MGLRFRKHINLGGGARLNFSKSGIGYSFGTKGVRFTKKAGGGTRSTYSIPGTGISYVNDSGRNAGRRKRNSSSRRADVNYANESGRSKTWLWVLGWLFVFPLALTILLLRKSRLKRPVAYVIIAVAWIIYLLLLIGGSGSSSTDVSRSTSGSTTSSYIESIILNDTEELSLKVGEKYTSGKARIEVRGFHDFTEDDLSFINENPNVAAITFTKEQYSNNIRFEIEALSPGETNVYFTSNGGEVISDKLKVHVLAPVLVESISLDGSKTDMILGESMTLNAAVLPDNAENKALTWSSSDESVATVDQEGNVLAVGSGSATITAVSVNDISSSINVNVDGSRGVLKLWTKHIREDDNNIGDEWSFYTELNGERTANEYALAVGETLNCYAKFTESDDNPDVGEAWASHTVTEDDLLNGFTVSMDLYVTENGGRNSGQSAHYVVTYDFSK